MKKKLIIIFLVLIGIIVFWKLNSGKKVTELPISVVSTIPKNSAVFVNEKSEVILALNRIITNKEGNNLKVEIQPSTKTQIVYQENKIRISPETEFSLNTNYEIKINYKENLIYTLNFETNPFSKTQIQDEGLKQSQLDLDFNEIYEKFIKDYPWYKKIPIETKNYIIVYDFEKKSFKIILKNKIQSEEERQSIIRDAISDIEKIGVKKPINNYYLLEIN